MRRIRQRCSEELFFGWGFGCFFFDCHVIILNGIKYFAAVLAFNEFDIVLAGDNFDDGMFAGGSHCFGECIDKDSALTQSACQSTLPHFGVLTQQNLRLVCGGMCGKDWLRALRSGSTLSRTG